MELLEETTTSTDQKLRRDVKHMEETVKRGKRRISSIDHSALVPDNHPTCHLAEQKDGPSSTIAPVVKSIRQSGEDPSASSISYTCNLPPTCNRPNHKPARFDNPTELEAHHRTHHAFTCSATDCHRIFPSQFFLDLHLNEVHNPILLVQRESRQAKIFRCFEPSCERSFSSPKTRRLHLVDFHGYPQTFFFSLPNQGLNNLYKKFGPGVSLVRPEWKAATVSSNTSSPDESSTADSKDTLQIASTSSINHSGSPSLGSVQNGDQHDSQMENDQQTIDSVIETIQQISLVPRQIQFGKKAGSKSFQR
ncbi:hypothetical protein PGT21_034736 [Puccinia graminis f. sp. tritici]|uniref:C2H2-type domain-containing protein n=1 Tax=Puccinia graminis f. sp. tritici TaxID=56615 RepID=A0A5B0NE47_PUCGR|nr:hypothetical protein PGT21_034736 [Puccinia graminis f. sp. tritici]